MAKTKRIDTSTPDLFRDEPAALCFQRATCISDLKNFGPKTETEFHRAGIRTVAQFQKLGWQKTILKLAKANPKNLHTIWAYAIIGALENTIWTGLSEQQKKEARKFVTDLRSKLTKSKKSSRES